MTQPKPQTALITGAGSGIGKATALAFAKSGLNLALVGRSLDKLDAVATIARTSGVTVTTHAVDLAEVEQVRDRMAAVVQSLPQLDIVINNAGMGYTGSLMEMSLTDWQQVMNLNLTSVFQVSQAVLPKLRQQQQGTIINVSSIAAHQTFPEWGAYCVSKFGLRALSTTLAAEERAHGIRVMTVSPGSVNTPLWDTETVDADFDRNAMLTPELVADAILHMALMPMAAAVEDMTLMPNAGTF
ncbi:SDR family oxidoreductase [filamentous cyanobacterium LEGE 11480]|uniref:SDR family oxidoreductase n=1 Tax=Romeriopsis navalis LEGE 11480 TaxID=2777977 RepID=A0A928VPI9_9CYAN|nr:SDR family oxidoreductase [Romeriopsis navalis]MBE9032316.1 SDR family oxidoreductase [Romeriopsis navalis LEGE 11480]